MGKYLARQQLSPSLALISTARCAQETWELAYATPRQEIDHRQEQRIYEASLDDLLGLIRKTPAAVDTLLLVGHNPGFEQVAKSLVGTGRPAILARLEREYPTAGLAVIDFNITNWRQAKKHRSQLKRLESTLRIEKATRRE